MQVDPTAYVSNYSRRSEDIIGFALCVCLSGCQKLIISSLHHILHSPGGFGPIQARPSVRSSVRAQKVHLKGSKLLKLI